ADLHGADRLLRSSIDRASRRDRLGPGAARLRQQHRGGNREDAVRPLLHQEPVARSRSANPVRDGGDHAVWRRRERSASTGRARDEAGACEAAMKMTALDIFVCPACKKTLDLSVSSRQGREILEGSLTCGACQTTYPITGGIP